MSFDAQQVEILKSATAKHAVQLVEVLSQLLNDQITTNVTNVSEALSLGGQAKVSEPTVMTRIKIDPVSSGEVYLYVNNATAAQVANLMMGDVAAAASMDDVKLDAYNSAMQQAFADLVTKLKFLKVSSINSALLDPSKQETLKIAGHQESSRVTVNLSVQFASGISSNVSLEMSEELASILIKNSGMSSAGSRDSSILGTDFAEIKDMHDPDTVNEKRNLNLLMDIRMGLIVELGRAEMHLKDILKLTKGSIIELDRLSGEAVDLFVNNKLIARGEVVVIDDNFGLRITQLAGNAVNPSDLGLVGVDND